MDKVQILFVDDEDRLLSGLRRMLRDQRGEWDMHFANSGREALDLMASQRMDVVVSDMRMPEMNGAELLAAVQSKCPETIRIILSGYAENETVMQTVGISHQYLAKPCDPELLKSTIARTLNIRPYLQSEGLRTLVTSIRNMPVPTETFTRLIAEIDSPDSSVASVSRVLESDIALSTQVLKLTKSAYFSLPQKTNSVEQAVRLLGLETIYGLATIANFFQVFRGGQRHQRIVEILNARSMAVGMVAQRVCKARGCRPEDAEAAYCGGLLAHVGTLVLIANRPDEFDAAMAAVDQEQSDLIAAEHGEFGASHADLGAYLLGIWGFDSQIMEAVRLHHVPVGAGEIASVPRAAVFMAQLLTKIMGPDAVLDASIDVRTLDGIISSHTDLTNAASALLRSSEERSDG